MGHQVLHLATPVTLGHGLPGRSETDRARLATWREGGRAYGDRLDEYVPLAMLPWAMGRWGLEAQWNLFLSGTPGLRRVLARRSFLEPDLLLIDQPRFAGLERLVRARTVIYRATDLYGDMTGDPSIHRAERWILTRAHGMIATSAPVLEHLRDLRPGMPSLLLENGVELQSFLAPQPEPAEYRPGRCRLVYAGALDMRFDFEAVAALALARPDLDLYLIGPGTWPTNAPPPNVHMLGPRPYHHLPAYFQHADIGLLPMNDHPANAGRSPMKIYEYAAAGLPVVARRTPELERRRESFLTLYGRPEALPSTLDVALSRPWRRDAVRAVAAGHAWETKAKRLLEFSHGLV